MLGITYETAKDKDLIRFPHPSEPRDLFFLEPGKDIVIHDSFTGTDRRCACKPIGSMHFECENSTWHIHQFAELMAKNGHTYEPAEPIRDLTLFDTRYLDRENLNEAGKPIPYRVLWCNNGAFIHGEGWFDRQMPEEDRLAICVCPEAHPSRQVCLVDGKGRKEFLSVPDLIKRMDDIPMERFERRQIEHLALERTLQNKAKVLADAIKDAKDRAANQSASQGSPAKEPER